MDNNKMTSSSGKHAIGLEYVTSKVNRWIALPMLALTVFFGIIDIQTGKICWATTMFLCAAWWVYVCIKEFILRKRHGPQDF